MKHTFTVTVTMRRETPWKAPTDLNDHEIAEMTQEIKDHLENCWPCSVQVEQVGRPWPKETA